MNRSLLLLSALVSAGAFASHRVHFALQPAPSLALVQSFVAAKSPSVVWTGAGDWTDAVCETYLFRPDRSDKENTLYDKDNRIECHGTNAAGEKLTALYPLTKVGVEFWGDFRSHNSSTLTGEGVNELGAALNVGRKLNLGDGLFDPFNLCGDGMCIAANDLMTKKKTWNGTDWDYGRTTLTCSQYYWTDEKDPTKYNLHKTDCFIIDVTE